ncbi:MAG: pyridoxamine 5'-phosphate oxidase [Planctomycetota bacterium]|jgi:pyridoxamine 5'-phosphate oxidase
MSLADLFTLASPLPATLPDDPFGLFVEWFEGARDRRDVPNPNAMTLATVDRRGCPDARVVLCKSIEAPQGCVVFHTNYLGAKGRQIEANPEVSLVLHWDHTEQQVRMRGPVTRIAPEESDEYFQTRHWTRRLGAWASHQSEPLANRMQLLKQIVEVGARFKVNPLAPDKARIPRPENWGGYRVWVRELELWMGGPGRVHDRARWTRTLTPAADGYECSTWSSTRLQP